MQTLGLLVVPVLVLGFYHRFLRLSLRFFLRMLMDFFSSTFKFIAHATELTCGILLLGYFSPIFNVLGLLLIFIFCLRFLRSSSKSNKSRDENIKNDNNNNNNGKEENVSAGVEDEVFDVMSLRKMVKAERQRYNAACAEIEKEQGAAASAAEEAMAMILRLQNEKSAVEIQAKQFRRVVEQKQEYDLEVMESLRWTVEQVESQKNLVERQLKALKERLRNFLNEREIQQLHEEQEKEQEIEEEQQHDVCESEDEQHDVCEIGEEQHDMREIEDEQHDMSEIEEEQHDMCEIEEEQHDMSEIEEERHDMCEIEEEHDTSEIEEEEDGIGTGTCTGTASVSDDADSSGFLNFSVEYDVDILPEDSSQNQSPTHNLAQQQQL